MSPEQPHPHPQAAARTQPGVVYAVPYCASWELELSAVLRIVGSDCDCGLWETLREAMSTHMAQGWEEPNASMAR